MERTGLLRPLTRIAAVLFCLAGMFAAIGSPSWATSGHDIAQSTKGNVVRIIAEWQNGATHNGFGFIVGERNGQLYVATANHVLRGSLPDEVATNVSVTRPVGDQQCPA